MYSMYFDRMGQQTLAPTSFWRNWNVLRLDPRKSMRSIKAWWWHIGFMLPTKKSECETWWRDILKTKPHLPLENENQVSTVGTHVLGKKTSISAPHLAASFPRHHLQLPLDALDNDFRPTGHGALYALDFLGQTPGRQGTWPVQA